MLYLVEIKTVVKLLFNFHKEVVQKLMANQNPDPLAGQESIQFVLYVNEF